VPRETHRLGDTPGLAAVRALDQVRLIVPRFVVIQASVHGIRIMFVGLDVVDKSILRDAIDLVDFTPVFSAVLRNVDQAVVRADVQQSLDNRRLTDRGDVAVLRHCQ